MRNLKNLFKFYIESSIHVALAVSAMTATTRFYLPTTITPSLLAFIFFSTVTGYNFVKYAGVAKLHHRSLTKHLKAIQLFSLASFVILLVLSFFQSFQVLIISAILSFFTIFYAIPFLPQQKNLRSLKSIKVFVIALVWAGTCVLLPLNDFSKLITAEVIFQFVQLFVFVLALIIPFEIRDLNYDNTALGTLPQLLGVKRTKITGYFLLIIFLGLCYLTNQEISVFSPSLVIATITAFAIFFSSKNQRKYYASFWVEAIPITWLALLLAFH